MGVKRTFQWDSSAVLVVMAILMACAVDVASAQSDPGRRTLTQSLEITETTTDTITPPPTPTRSLSSSFEITASDNITVSQSLPASVSSTVSITPKACEMLLSSTFDTDSIEMSTIHGAPPDTFGTLLRVFAIPATTFSRGDNAITVAFKYDGIFNFTADAEDLVYFSAKTELLYSSLGSAESIRRSPDFNSLQKHGIAGVREKRKDSVFFDKTLKSFTIMFTKMESYRIYEDEWVYISFREDATIPPRCATQIPVVLHIKTRERGFWYSYTQFVSFFALLCGVTAAVASTSIPSSHHAGMIAILATLHFAQEDGKTLGLPIHPLQVGLGDTKYQYIRAAIVCNCSIVLVVLVAQVVGMFLLRTRGYGFVEASKLVIFPRILIAVLVHLAPGTWYAIARNFGNQTTSNFILSFSSLVFFTGGIFWGFHHLFSSTSRLLAKYIPGQPPTYSLLTDLNLTEKHIDQAHNTFLRRSLPELISFIQGHWKPIDSTGTFVLTHGFTFENYTKKGKNWMGLELVDIFLCTMLTVFDNYTRLLAFFQFFITLLVKVGSLMFMIRLRPVNSYHSSILLFILYCCETLAAFALVMGSVRKELEPASDYVQKIACAVGATVLAIDCLLVITRSFYIFSRSLKRSRDFEIEDRTDDHAVPLLDGFLDKSDVATEMKKREKEELAVKEEHEERVRRAVAEALGGTDRSTAEGDTETATVTTLTMGDEAEERRTPRSKERLNAVSFANEMAHGGRRSSTVNAEDHPHHLQEDDDSDNDSAYDSDGLPVLSHPRHLEREAKMVRGIDPDLQRSGDDEDEDDDDEARHDLDWMKSHDDGQGLDGSVGDDVTAISRRLNVSVSGRRIPLWTELAESTAGVRQQNSRLNEGDFDEL